MLELQESNTEQDENLTTTLADPFAVDFFGSSVAVTENTSEVFENKAEVETFFHKSPMPAKVKKTPWQQNLRKISRNEIKLSNEVLFLPSNLSQVGLDKINETLSHYIFGLNQEVSNEVLDIREVNIWQEAVQAEKENCVFVSFGIEPSRAKATVILDVGLASHLVDQTLGGIGISGKVQRNLSNTEKTVVEFLGAGLLSELNTLFGETYWKIHTVEQKMPNWLQPENVDANEKHKYLRGVSVILSLKIGQANGIVSMLFSTDLLKEIIKSETLFFDKKSDSTIFKQYKNVKPVVDSHFLIGTSEFRAFDLAGLEAGDYVFIENSFIEREEGIISGQGKIRLGQSNGFSLFGEAQTNEKGILEFEIIEIITEDGERNLERMKMDGEDLTEDFNEQADFEPQNSGLENILLNVRVELAGRKMTLEEVSRFRNGQILELGCKATDSVDLMADDKRIATGDLVDVEGNLGIILTKVFI